MTERFAQLADYELRYGSVAGADADRVDALLADASAMLLAAYEARWGGYAAGEHPAFDRSAAAVACAAVSRAVNVPAGFAGVTQCSQTAGDYSASATFANPTADLWLSRGDLKRLGLAGCRVGSIPAAVNARA